MPCIIERIHDNLMKATFHGKLDQVARQTFEMAARQLLAKTGKINVLVELAKDFSGVAKSDHWANVDFYAEHANDIVKMAVVGDPKWHVQAYDFTNAYARKTAINFLPAGESDQALKWLKV